MAHSHHNSNLLHNQRGTTAIWFALFLPVLIGFTAVAVDLSRLNLIKTELQNAADAAALAGARSLTAGGGTPYNWSAASETARTVATKNYGNGRKLEYALIDPGYWNIPGSSFTTGTTSTKTGDVPAVRASVPISSAHNNGPVQLFFAPILGISNSNMQATSTAAIAPAAGGTGMFPFALNSEFIDDYWNCKTKSFSTSTVTIDTTYPKGSGDGQWTSLKYKSEAESYISNLITNNGNSNYLSVGDSIWIADGAMANLYGKNNTGSSAVVGKIYAMPVVSKAKPGSSEKIIALVAFQIDEANQGQKYIKGHFVNNYIFPNLDAGNGNAVAYGAYTPPFIVK